MENEISGSVQSYLTFKIGNEVFATHVSVVLNIIEVMDITKVPHAPVYMKGIVNLRGMVLPVIDTRLKLGMSETQFTEKTCIIVMDIMLDGELVHLGVLVDEVSEVLIIDKANIEPAPSIGGVYKSKIIKGISRVDNKLIMIIDVIHLFSEDELFSLSSLNKSLAQ